MEEGARDKRLVLLGSLLYTAGSAIQYVSPAYFADLGRRLGIDEGQMGSLSAAENIGIGLASVLAIWWNGRFDRRMIALLAVFSCVAGDVASFLCREFPLLLVLRGLTATFGEGTLFAMAFAVLAATRNADRMLGFALSSVVLFTSVVLATAPILDRMPIGSGWLVPVAAIALPVLPALHWMPLAQSPQSAQARAASSGQTGWQAATALIGLTIWAAAPSSFWVFAADIAQSRHFTSAGIGSALAVGNGVGLLGSALAAWQGNRWQRSGSILVGSACLLMSVAAAQGAGKVAVLSIMLAAFNTFWNYTMVYAMALVVALDRTGKVAPGISGAQMAGFAIGAFTAGQAIVAEGSFSVLTPLVGAFAAGGLLLFAVCRRYGENATAQPV